jgi:hypothetical protein
MFSFTLNRFQAAGIGIIHGYIMGMIMSYLVFGITCKKQDRRIIIALGCGMLGFFLDLDWWFEIVLILSCSLLTVVARPRCLYRDKGKADGDYGVFLEGDFDRSWFDFVIEGISDYPILFPPEYREL